MMISEKSKLQKLLFHLTWVTTNRIKRKIFHFQKHLNVLYVALKYSTKLLKLKLAPVKKEKQRKKIWVIRKIRIKLFKNSVMSQFK